MYKKKAPVKKNTVIKANCGASVKAHGKAKAMKLQSGGMIGKIKKNEVFGTEEKRQEDMDRYMSQKSSSRRGNLSYNKGGAIGSSRSGAVTAPTARRAVKDTPEEEDIRAARRSERYKNGKNGKNGTENNNGRKIR